MLIILLLVPVGAFSEPLKDYVPYQPDEFPIWSYSIRRAETLFFGSLVITMPVALLLYRLAQTANIVSAPTNDLQAYLVQGSIAASLSLGIAVTDYILGKAEKQ